MNDTKFHLTSEDRKRFQPLRVNIKPNTAFNNSEAYIYVKSDATYNDVRADLEPLLKDIKAFDALANQKKYTTNIKAGKYKIVKGMNNNDIINSIRKHVAEKCIDLIVMGTKGATGLEKVVFGSNTVHVMQRCVAPILAIPDGCLFISTCG